MDTEARAWTRPSEPNPAVGAWLVALLTACFASLTTAFIVRSSHFPPCCDANGYLMLGQEMWAKGLSAKLVLSDLRTIGYPAFIAFAVWLPVSLSLGVKVAILQSLLYWLASMAVLRSSHRILVDLASRRALAAGLLGNPLAAMYCAETMTEGLSLTVCLAVLAILLRVRKSPIERRQRFTIPFWLGLLAGLGLIVRPANLALVVGALVAMAIPPLFASQPLKRRLVHAGRSLVVTSVGIYVAVSPQVAVNLKLFNKATPFPSASLGDLQMREGIRHLKYATFVGATRTKQVRYASPFATGTEVLPTDTVGWYLRNPGRGLLNVAGHVFAAVDQDPFFTYVRDFDPWYRIPLVGINALVVVFGLGWLAKVVWLHRRKAALDPAACFLLSTTTVSLAILAFAIPESRFGLLAASVCLASACIGAVRIFVAPRKVHPGWIAAGLACVVIFSLLALRMRDLAIL